MHIKYAIAGAKHLGDRYRTNPKRYHPNALPLRSPLSFHPQPRRPTMASTLSNSTTLDQAQQIALDFLINEWELSAEDSEWFSVLSCRAVGETWSVVEIGIEGLPDKWVLQVFDTGYCDPNYTFSSPVQASESDTGLDDMPERIAEIIASERCQS
ncbi:MAG: hypothetical protein AAGA75_01440 [Cyanobacteria bacterium P01_E01_bin.6]